jgi:hypothetical protein
MKSIYKLPIIITFIFSLFFAFMVGSKLISDHGHGGIKKLFILQTESGPRMTAWVTKKYKRKVGAHWDQKLISFDLLTGKLLGQVKMVDGYHEDEYRIYHSSGSQAWGINEKKEVHLLDLETPKIIANVTLSDIPKSAFKVDSNTMTDWYFVSLKDGMGKHAHTKGAKSSPESVSLLDPEFIPDLNPGISSKDKVWVLHKSALLGDYDPLISYVSANGEEHGRISLTDILDDNHARAVYTYSQEKEILVFIVSSAESVGQITLWQLPHSVI